MKLSSLSLSRAEWPHAKDQCCEFFLRYINKRLIHEDIHCLAALSYNELQLPGTSIVTATVRSDVGDIPVGIGFAANYGEDAWMVAVHPLYRNRGIGSSLIRLQLNQLGRLQCKVPADHSACLKMCFHAGLQAVAMEQGSITALIMKGITSADSIQVGELLCQNPS